jgi:hypothetical protein
MNESLNIYYLKLCSAFSSLGISAVNNSLQVYTINLIRTFCVVIITN